MVRVDLPAALVSRQPTTPRTTPRTGRSVYSTYWAGRSRAVCSPSPRSAVAMPVRPAEGDGGGAGKGGKDGGLAAAFTSTASLHRPHAQPRCTSKRSGRSVCPVAAPGSQGARRACPSNRRCGRLRAVWWRRSRDPPVRDCGRFGVKVGARGAQGSPRRRCRLRAGPWGGRGGRYGARGASGPLRVELASRLTRRNASHSSDP